jgi:hypothetical protein
MLAKLTRVVSCISATCLPDKKMAKSLATQRNPANTFKEETKHNNTQNKQTIASPGKPKAPGKLPAPNPLLPTTCPLPEPLYACPLFAQGCRVWPG